MATSPAFQFYPDDFLGSGTVGSADAHEVGAYILLMCLDWGETGFAYDEKRLARWCRLSVPAFRKAWAHLSPKFPARDGRHYNPRLEEERAKQAAFRERAQKGAAKTNAQRWGSGRSSDTASDAASDAQATASESLGGRTPSPSLSLTPVTTTTTPTTLPAPRKPRESGPAERVTWLTPAEQAWEAVNGVGSFDLGQAQRELSKIYRKQDGGDPRKLTAEQIAGRIAWYLRVKGLEHPDPTPDMLERRAFTPSLRDFRLRHGKFSAGDPPATADSEAAA